MYSEQVIARWIAAGDDEVCADVALVAEQMLLQLGHHCDHARFAFSREGMELDVGRDEGGGEFGVGSGTGSCAPDLGCNVMKLLAVLEKVSQVHMNIDQSFV